LFFKFTCLNLHSCYEWCTPNLLDGLDFESKDEDNKRRRSWACSLARNTLGVEGRAGALRWGLRRLKSKSIDSHRPTQTNNKLITAQLKHLWCIDEPRVNTDSQDSPRPRLGEATTFPPYSRLCAWPWDQHPNVILFRGLKQNCSPRQELSNDMWHTICMQGKGWFLTFNGWESNCQFDFWPYLWP
jgi:hypothetical protein